jgi:hypothetical protein
LSEPLPELELVPEPVPFDPPPELAPQAGIDITPRIAKNPQG